MAVRDQRRRRLRRAWAPSSTPKRNCARVCWRGSFPLVYGRAGARGEPSWAHSPRGHGARAARWHSLWLQSCGVGEGALARGGSRRHQEGTRDKRTPSITKQSKAKQSKTTQRLVCGRLTSSFLAEAFRPTPVSRKRSPAVSPAGLRSDPCTWHVAAWKACVGNDLQPRGCRKPVAAIACGRWLWKACGCNGLWPLVVEGLISWGGVAPRTCIVRHCNC